MRKMFRFKYEPCNGTCYHWCDSLIRHLKELERPQRELLVQRMVGAHDRLCDNPDFSFGVDVDDQRHVFVAHFRTPEKTDLFLSPNFSECVERVCAAVMQENIPQLAGACVYGGNGAEDLGREILRFCTEAAAAELEERHCDCKAG